MMVMVAGISLVALHGPAAAAAVDTGTTARPDLGGPNASSQQLGGYPSKSFIIPLDVDGKLHPDSGVKGAIIAYNMITIGDPFVTAAIDTRHGLPTKLWNRDTNKVSDINCTATTDLQRATLLEELHKITALPANSPMLQYIHDHAKQEFSCEMSDRLAKPAGGISYTRVGAPSIFFADAKASVLATYVTVAADNRFIIIYAEGTAPDSR
jgi:hypothetical protein